MTESRTDFGPGFHKWSWESEYAALSAGPSAMAGTRPHFAPADPAARGGLSRRDFIKSVIAAAAVASSATYMLSTRRAAAATAVAERLVTLNVNGEERRVEVLPQETLATTLRYKLGLTGTKFGCDRAECGACTVLLDDVQHYSCSTLTMMVRGRAITTVEGVSDNATGELHPVQQAFIDELGPQCGFCTPGQVMSAVALLRANPTPTEEEARIWMSGNLCRCGAYDHYLKGVMRAAGRA